MELQLTCIVPEIIEIQKPVHYDREVFLLGHKNFLSLSLSLSHTHEVYEACPL